MAAAAATRTRSPFRGRPGPGPHGESTRAPRSRRCWANNVTAYLPVATRHERLHSDGAGAGRGKHLSGDSGGRHRRLPAGQPAGESRRRRPTANQRLGRRRQLRWRPGTLAATSSSSSIADDHRHSGTVRTFRRRRPVAGHQLPSTSKRSTQYAAADQPEHQPAGHGPRRCTNPTTTRPRRRSSGSGATADAKRGRSSPTSRVPRRTRPTRTTTGSVAQDDRHARLPGLLPGLRHDLVARRAGDSTCRGLDAAGNLIGRWDRVPGSVWRRQRTLANARMRIPAVAGQSYYLRVSARRHRGQRIQCHGHRHRGPGAGRTWNFRGACVTVAVTSGGIGYTSRRRSPSSGGGAALKQATGIGDHLRRRGDRRDGGHRRVPATPTDNQLQRRRRLRRGLGNRQPDRHRRSAAQRPPTTIRAARNSTT